MGSILLASLLVVNGAQAATPEMADADRTAIASAVITLVDRALSEAPVKYRLAVVDGAQLGGDAATEAKLAPIYQAIRANLAKISGLELVAASVVNKRGRKLLAAPQPKEKDWVLALGKAVGANGVLVLPGTVDRQRVMVPASWVDVDKKMLMAALAIKIAAPASAESCQQAVACAKQGLCTARGGRCVAGSDDDCRKASICSLGMCSARGGQCVATSNADCEHTKLCAEMGKCMALGGRCVSAVEAEEIAATPPAPAANGGMSATRPPPVDEGPAGPLEKRRSLPMMIIGLGMCGTGLAGAGVGGLVIAIGTSATARTCSKDSAGVETCRLLTDAEKKGAGDVGLGIVITSAVIAVAGIPFAIIGALKVPVEPEVPQASLVPSVGVGPGALSLTWHF